MQDALDLVAGVDGPGTGCIEFDIGLPVFQGFARLANFFVGESEVVVSVGVSGSELDGHFICLNAFLDASGFVEDIAQIEIGEGVARVSFQGGAIMFFGEREILAIVIKSSEIDVGGGVVGLELERFLVGGEGFGLSRRIFFERDAAGEPDGGIVLTRGGFGRGDGVVVTIFS